MFQARDHSTRDTLLWDDNDGGPEKIIMKQCFLPFILNSTHAGAQTFREIRTKASWIFVRVGVLILCGSYHKSQTRWLTTTEIYSLRVLEAEVLKSGCPQGHIVPKGSRGKSSFWLFQLLETSGASLVAQMVKICPQYRRPEFNSWVRKIPWRSEWLPTPVLLPREFHVQRSLADHSSWGCKDLGTTGSLTLSLGLWQAFQVTHKSAQLDHAEFHQHCSWISSVLWSKEITHHPRVSYH